MSAPESSLRRGLFREAALERMSSPERLEMAARIVRPTSWLLLLAAAIAVVVAVAACVLIQVPVRVQASGILLSPAGLRNVVVNDSGRIAAIMVKPGDRVRAGEVVARLDFPEIHQQIATSEAGLRDARARLSALLSGSEDGERLRAGIAEAETGVAALKARLDRDSRIESPVAGTIDGLNVEQDDVVTRGAALMTVLPASEVSLPLRTVLYVPLSDSKRIRPGMRVELSPAGNPREEYGSIVGRVARVAAMPATPDAMERKLKNRQLVEMFLAAGPAVEVEAELDPDATAPTGYRWTSSRGPADKLGAGTPCQAAITVRSQSLLTLLVPAARRLFSEGT